MSKKNFKLISGTFPVSESKEILQNVFRSKINFHQMKNFSSQERFGKDDEKALKRITQLNKSLKDILQLLEKAEKKGNKITMTSEVQITIE